MTHSFHAHGKLLLTAEYFVLDGALALALPVKLGQSLKVFPQEKATLYWESLDEKGNPWFSATFCPDAFSILKTSDPSIAQRLQKILLEAFRLTDGQLPTANCQLQTVLTFPRPWGLGTSSTLIYLLAKWAQVDPFELQFRTFGGSGYDIACAGAGGPILYKLDQGKPVSVPCKFRPSFSNCLYFIYLGKKQDSREGIAHYRQKVKDDPNSVTEVSLLTHEILSAKTLAHFDESILEHEKIVGGALGLPRAKSLYFNDFWGEVKSLGAWGGDFVLATSERSEKETRRYFEEKGFATFLNFEEMVLGEL